MSSSSTGQGQGQGQGSSSSTGQGQGQGQGSSSSTGQGQGQGQGQGSSSSTGQIHAFFPLLKNFREANAHNAHFFRRLSRETIGQGVISGSEVFTEADRYEIQRLVSEKTGIPIYNKKKGVSGIAFGRQGEIQVGERVQNGQRRDDILILLNSSRDGLPDKTHFTIHFPVGEQEKSRIGPIHIRTVDNSNYRRPVSFEARVIPQDVSFTIFEAKSEQIKKQKKKLNGYSEDKIKATVDRYRAYIEKFPNGYVGILLNELRTVSDKSYNPQSGNSIFIAAIMVWAVEQVINEKIRAKLLGTNEPVYPILPFLFTRPNPGRATLSSSTVSSSATTSTSSSKSSSTKKKDPGGGAGSRSRRFPNQTYRKNRKSRISVKTRKLANFF